VENHSHSQETSWTGSTLPNNTTAFFSQSDPWELSLSSHDRAFADTSFDRGPLMAISPIPTQEPQIGGGAGSSRWTLTDSPSTQDDAGEDKESRKEDTVRKYHVWLPKLVLPQPSTQSQILPGLFVESATSKSGYLGMPFPFSFLFPLAAQSRRAGYSSSLTRFSQGRHSIGGTLASCLRDAHERNSDLQKPAFNFISKAAYYVDKVQDHALLGGFEYDLPLRSFAAQSIEGTSCLVFTSVKGACCPVSVSVSWKAVEQFEYSVF
jgi:hypothetical protein